MKKQWVSILLVMWIGIFIFPLSAKALSCEEVREPVIDHYDLAVIGSVLDVNDFTGLDIFFQQEEPFRYVWLEAEKSWKQGVPSQLTFTADFTWGTDFEKGQKYLIYLNEENGEYQNSPCSPVQKVEEDVEIKGNEALFPDEEGTVGWKNWLTFQADIIGISGLIIFGLAVILGIVIVRRKKNEVTPVKGQRKSKIIVITLFFACSFSFVLLWLYLYVMSGT
ncbi:hypothetical protein F9U64_06420 [Gracilibacillus oryzae]|uniref:Uncharacterized protein n=1 Tax=Gracilibacillus oryzae TaxID=1672701 RepID=A0A7C8GVA8_9BACI|nr:hypothetical protein [Gracilibacillus oryzae]KAB8138077.1 hypothetical protein F9U64_06420 [Gracilibacillus oryzae]